MSFNEDFDFDDSLDDLLANISLSQLDPKLKNKCNTFTDIKEFKTIETQTDCNFNKTVTKVKNNRKRRIRIVKTDKHHHKPCVYHRQNSGHKDYKKFKTSLNSGDNQLNESDIFVDFNNENETKLIVNQSVNNESTNSHTINSSQLVLISNPDLSSSDNSSQLHLFSDDINEDNLNISEKSMDLFDDQNRDKSFNMLETDEESDSERSPLHPLVSYDNSDKSELRLSQNQLINDEDMFKSQNSQNSNSSQNSIFSFYEY